MSTVSKVNELVEVCRRYGKTSIIAAGGAPGTGKSLIALIAAQEFAGEPTRVKEIQFHQTYSYEEFVEGLRIAGDGSVKSEKGVFMRLNEDAWADNVPGHNYVLLIEEFTRANISSVLGELLTYVEHRDRSFETMFSKTAVQVASNLVILVTFNPVDRSALNIDDALLRRMRVVDFLPDVEQLREMLGRKADLQPHVINQLCKIFTSCEKEHPEEYETRVPFGHGIFSEIETEGELHALWEQRIRRMLHRTGTGTRHPFYETIRDAYPWHKSPRYLLPDNMALNEDVDAVQNDEAEVDGAPDVEER